VVIVEVFDQFMWLPFLVAITALTLTPGVDTVLVMRNSARGGGTDGLATSLGICLGLYLHAFISAAGLSAILLGSAELFLLLKIAGAGYLIYLGIQSLRSAWANKSLRVGSPSVVLKVPLTQSLREGFLSNVLNPKPIVFYMAFLPQFINPDYSPVLQAMLMATVHFVIGMLWQGALALTVSKARAFLEKPLVSRLMDSITGVVLVGFGVKLGASQ